MLHVRYKWLSQRKRGFASGLKFGNPMNMMKRGTHYSRIKGCLQTEDRRPKTWKSIK